MMLIGLTGGIGSGKSTVAKMFKSLGVPVYDSDSEAKTLMVESKPLRKAIIGLLGEEAYLDKKLNKSFISSQVFKKPDLLQKLNEIVHPAVKNHFLKWSENQNFEYVIQETALVFENKAQDNYDSIILVTAPKGQRIQRVIDRDASTEKEVLERMANQLDDNKKVSLSNYVIENLDLDATWKLVCQIHKKLLNKGVEL
ncbi:dephospho-CoA kinase [Croceitalea rosinachiae]|uniref:Dephospho-CoA kinase n=1 Tax=Croceitalea rosinachiae TaxID=3075596 RepID=A0ABU3ABT1_9FLAO|nr:dephospho-CoA kinase [Croceitalea sp. F388]MDT0607280.1 dephospho-CoA kinase [Croceitalea sp. F388]